jgi:hypothetical protein
MTICLHFKFVAALRFGVESARDNPRTAVNRACARLCHSGGGELEQIQFLLGHVSVQTREKYLGCKQRLREAVNDQIGIEPGSENAPFTANSAG